VAVKKTCRICGASYEACRSAKNGSTAFNWQEVACSPECGSEYLRRVNESRGLIKKSKGKSSKRDIPITANNEEAAEELPVETETPSSTQLDEIDT